MTTFGTTFAVVCVQSWNTYSVLNTVLRIRIRRVCKFLNLQYPDPDPYSSIPSSSKNRKKNLDFYCFHILSLKTDVNVPSKSNKQKNLQQNYQEQYPDLVQVQESGSVPKGMYSDLSDPDPSINKQKK
jgi:hypothetical protein